MASVRVSEISINPNAFLHILKTSRKRRARQKRMQKTTFFKKALTKMNTWSARYGRSLAPTWAAPFFGVNPGAPVGLQKTSKTQ